MRRYAQGIAIYFRDLKTNMSRKLPLHRAEQWPFLSVGLQGSYILTPDPDRLTNRRPSRLFSYFSYFSYSASLGSLSAINYRAELCMLLYNYGNTLIYLYLDLQSEYYQLSLHFFDPGLATDNFKYPSFSHRLLIELHKSRNQKRRQIN